MYSNPHCQTLASALSRFVCIKTTINLMTTDGLLERPEVDSSCGSSLPSQAIAKAARYKKMKQATLKTPSSCELWLLDPLEIPSDTSRWYQGKGPFPADRQLSVMMVVLAADSCSQAASDRSYVAFVLVAVKAATWRRNVCTAMNKGQ